MSSRARNTQVQAITRFALVQEIVVSTQTHSVEISSQGLKNKVVAPGSLFEKEKIQQQPPTPPITSSMALDGHTHTHVQTHTPAMPILLPMPALHLPHGWREEPEASKHNPAKFCMCTHTHTQRNVKGTAQN